MAKFWELFQESVIIQGLVTTGLVGATIYLSIAGKPVPETLSASMALALGYYFGSKSQQVIRAQTMRR